jgi:addiction module HigA family antidote
MIRSFRDSLTRRVFERQRIPRLGPEVQRQAHRKLLLLDASSALEDLRSRRGTDWNASEATAPDSTASESTANGEFASSGALTDRMKSRSATTTRRLSMPRRAHPPIHPGEILETEYLEPLELSQYRLAKELSVPARRINEIVHGTRAISADTALRLARYFGTTDEFWLNLQMRYDLEVERDRLGPRLRKEVAVLERAS